MWAWLVEAHCFSEYLQLTIWGSHRCGSWDWKRIYIYIPSKYPNIYAVIYLSVCLPACLSIDFKNWSQVIEGPGSLKSLMRNLAEWTLPSRFYIVSSLGTLSLLLRPSHYWMRSTHLWEWSVIRKPESADHRCQSDLNKWSFAGYVNTIVWHTALTVPKLQSLSHTSRFIQLSSFCQKCIHYDFVFIKGSDICLCGSPWHFME